MPEIVTHRAANTLNIRACDNGIHPGKRLPDRIHYDELKIAGDESVRQAGYRNAAIPEQAPAPAPMKSAMAGQMANAAVPMYTSPQGAAPQYDAPFMPPFSWPAKAPYPNYSAVQYTKHYPSNAFPNIGPFYPYPEAPLDWREVRAYSLGAMMPLHIGDKPPPEWSIVKLRWEDGHWYMDFCHATWGGRGLLGRLHDTEAPEPTLCGSCMPGGGYHLWFKPVVCTHLYMD